MVTIGILPDYPEIGYGYIKFNPAKVDGVAYQVDCFVEKPSLDTAKNHLANGQHLWNSGIFVWKASSILHNIQKFMPQTYIGLDKIQKAIGSEIESTIFRKYISYTGISIH